MVIVSEKIHFLEFIIEALLCMDLPVARKKTQLFKVIFENDKCIAFGTERLKVQLSRFMPALFTFKETPVAPVMKEDVSFPK